MVVDSYSLKSLSSYVRMYHFIYVNYLHLTLTHGQSLTNYKIMIINIIIDTESTK